MTDARLSPADVDRVGRTLYGEAWVAPLADALDMNRANLAKVKAGKAGLPSGVRAELAVLLRAALPRLVAERAALDARIAECLPLADAVERTVGLLYGVTRRELSLIGWLIGDAGLDDLPGMEDMPTAPGSVRWLQRTASPAEALRTWAGRELGDGIEGGRIGLADGEADRLLTALGRLTDEQALEVAAAARDVDDLNPAVPED